MKTEEPSVLVQRQLDAYNAKDVAAWLNTYAPDAEQYNLHGERLARGHEELKARILVRFEEPDFYARLLSRTALGNVVVDAEEITGTSPKASERSRCCAFMKSSMDASPKRRSPLEEGAFMSSPKSTPNPSLKRSANHRPPGPVWRYAVHFRQPGLGVLPSSPA